jgi:ATP-dependent Clp protease adaptor protein ClpS
MAEYSIILKNDTVNTFDHVINCLVNICGHNPIQAEQCATIVHYKGSCKVKTYPSFESSEEAFNDLKLNGLEVEYERRVKC